MNTGRWEGKKRKSVRYESIFSEVSAPLSPDLKRGLEERAKEGGDWLNMMPRYKNNNVLGEGEFRDGLLMRYMSEPSDLPSHCDGCGKKFGLKHALDCKTGGLITARHDELRDELCVVGTQAYSPAAIRDEPYVKSGRNRSGQDQEAADDSPVRVITRKRGEEEGELRGDLSIRGLWNRQTDTIIDVRITNSDAKSYLNKTVAKHLLAQEKEKKDKYLPMCREQRKNFTPFVATVDGILGREAKMMCKQLAKQLALKWARPVSVTQQYVNQTVQVAILRSVHRCIRGARASPRRPDHIFLPFEDGAGLGLYR